MASTLIRAAPTLVLVALAAPPDGAAAQTGEIERATREADDPGTRRSTGWAVGALWVGDAVYEFLSFTYAVQGQHAGFEITGSTSPRLFRLAPLVVEPTLVLGSGTLAFVGAPSVIVIPGAAGGVAYKAGMRIQLPSPDGREFRVEVARRGMLSEPRSYPAYSLSIGVQTGR